MRLHPRQLLKVAQQSLQTKLTLFIMLVATIPLLMFGFFSYLKSSQMINQQFGLYGNNSVALLQSQIDSGLRQMKFTATDILAFLLDPKFTILHEEVPSTYKGFQDEQQLEQFLKAHKTVDTKGIFIITQSGYYYGESTINAPKIIEEELFNKGSLYPDSYWFGIYEPKHYKVGMTNPEEKVIGLLFQIKNQNSFLEGSHILIEVSADKLLELFKEFEADTHSHIKLTDKQGRLIYQTEAGFSGKATDVVWVKSSEVTDWSIEVRIPYGEFYKSSVLIRTFTMVAAGFALLLALILSIIISSRFIRRIKRLKETIQLVGIGRLETRVEVDSEDELGRLAFSFNNMLFQLETLIGEVRHAEGLKKEAELRALHFQINPHLLLNTLASIQWKARLQGAQEVNKMIYHLTKVLDGNLNFTREIVTLDKELDLIDHFLNIQQLRYGRVFSYEIANKGIDLERVCIPRMTLQPLVENIFFHGFEDGEGAIRLSIGVDQGDAVVTLIDNGKGIKPEVLAHMLNANEHQQSLKRIGMFNVDQRIQLHFGYKYGLRVQSELGKGTSITIRLPYGEEGDAHGFGGTYRGHDR
ncbi:HAMP domain-containing protein [Paenibacillus sp. SYP-B3998]|uniref:HAMP domain-containing protein n=1 Tax=Paenibacillus sp. SYP-B3998 TaxID=2678564 RepID=A0A6G3ZSC5_9BACL|nr:histidine kinase [Paenibacillus sp. SYP-B3998]NEW04960.1 HAMP domain-containing protein [Paenibacillus sp. SYP-B3998]